MSDLEKLKNLKENQEISSKEKQVDYKIVKRVEAFMLENADRVRQWHEANPNQRPPVYYIEEEDRVVWLTRQQRKRIQQKKPVTLKTRSGLNLSNPFGRQPPVNPSRRTRKRRR